MPRAFLLKRSKKIISEEYKSKSAEIEPQERSGENDSSVSQK